MLKLLQIALTICVSTASCERSISALKQRKTYLRSTMHEERLANLAVLSVEHEISRGLCLQDVVDKLTRTEGFFYPRLMCVLLAECFSHYV